MFLKKNGKKVKKIIRACPLAPLCSASGRAIRNTCYALTPSDLGEGLFEALISLCSVLKKQKGFDLKEAFKKKKHFGLKNIQTRVEGLGGEVNYYTAEGEGTQVSVTLPY